MALVRGRETFTAVEIAKEGATWGAGPVEYFGVPLISEDLNIERDPLPDTEEISSLGAREALESGRLIVVGSVTVRPRWDAKWFNMLMSSLGTENVFSAKWLDGQTGTAATTAHVYAMSQTIPNAFHILVTKAGPASGADSTSFLFRGCIVSEMNWEQPNDNHPQVTFTFVGKDLVTATSLSTSPIVAVQGTVISKLRDLDQYKSSAGSPGNFQSRLLYRPSDATTLYNDLANVNTFTVNVNRGIDFDDPDVDTPDTVSKPGPQNQREVTLEIEGKYEQLSPAASHPYHDYANDNITGFAAYYSSSTELSSPVPYGGGIVIPRIVWTAGAANIDTGGTITYTASGTAIAATDVDSYTLAPSPSNVSGGGGAFHTTPANPEAYFITAVKNTDSSPSGSPFGPGVTGA